MIYFTNYNRDTIIQLQDTILNKEIPGGTETVTVTLRSVRLLCCAVLCCVLAGHVIAVALAARGQVSKLAEIQHDTLQLQNFLAAAST